MNFKHQKQMAKRQVVDPKQVKPRQTSLAINKLNQDFYQKISKHWNNNQNYFWDGWWQLDLASRFANYSSLKVLDIGCGNARFLDFLDNIFAKSWISYTGLDYCEYWLDLANQKRLAYPRHLVEITNLDLVLELLNNSLDLKLKGKFDLIVIFGLMHHLPSINIRFKILEIAKNHLNKDGLIVWTSWRFLDVPRLNKKILSTKSEHWNFLSQVYTLSPDMLSQNDFILGWTKQQLAFRYSHYLDQQEAKFLHQHTGLHLLKHFVSDGRLQNRNGYFLVKQ
jgi:SAM-dependent methyltransferase